MIRRAALLCTALSILAACSAQLYEPTDVPLHTPPDTALETIRDAIWQAARSQEWRVDEPRPGLTRANRTLRHHYAEIEIAYDTTSYSIRLIEASNFDHRGTTIHRNYNRWIARLETAIRERVAALEGGFTTEDL